MLCPKEKVKLNSVICVPENFCVVILSREKLLDEIPSGEYEINGLTCAKACKLNKLDKPTKKGYKTEFSADFYFVNLFDQSAENLFFVKKIKSNIAFEIKFSITNAKKFLEFLICEQICFENDFAFNELKFYVSQLIYYFVLDNKIVNFEKLNKYIVDKLLKIGVKVKNFEISVDDFSGQIKKASFEGENQIQMSDKNVKEDLVLLDKTENAEQEEKNDKNDFDLDYSKRLDENLKEKEEIKENRNLEQQKFQSGGFSKKSIVDLEDVESKNLKYFVCDKCGAKLSENTKKCFVCGKSFEEKNLCENCGKEIDKNDYVCPHCGSVLIQ